MAFGRTKVCDDFASATICTGERSMGGSFLASLDEDVLSSESLSPLDEVLPEDELEGSVPSEGVGSVTLVSGGGGVVV